MQIRLKMGAFGALNLSTQISPSSRLFSEVEGKVSGKAGVRMNF